MPRCLLVGLSFVALSIAGSGRIAVAKPSTSAAPTYWVGEVDAGREPGELVKGSVLVRGTAPAQALLVNPFDPDRFLTQATGSCADGECTYEASYARSIPDPSHPVPIFVLTPRDPKAPAPARIEPTAALRKTLTRAIKRPAGVKRGGETSIYAAGAVDLDADGSADVALLTGCFGDSDGGMCGMTRTAVLERKGKDFARIGELGGFHVSGPTAISEITRRYGKGAFRVTAYGFDPNGLRWEVLVEGLVDGGV